MLAVAVLVGTAVVLPIGSPVGAAAYDATSPASTGCVKKTPVDSPATVRTYGAFSIRLRRSAGCNTVWGVVTRTDTKKCGTAGKNCAMIRLVRVRGNGVRAATTWRKMQGGTKSVYSLQLNGLTDAVFTAEAATFAGKRIGSSGSLAVDAGGHWTTR
jgi:hypothetical protein